MISAELATGTSLDNTPSRLWEVPAPQSCGGSHRVEGEGFHPLRAHEFHVQDHWVTLLTEFHVPGPVVRITYDVDRHAAPTDAHAPHPAPTHARGSDAPVDQAWREYARRVKHVFSMSASTAPARMCCLDLDTFFVSVERLHDPSSGGASRWWSGPLPGKRGVVTAASYEVRELGVRSGMSIRDAVRLAPNAIFLPTRHGEYSRYSSPGARDPGALQSRVVRAASIDEFFVDFQRLRAHVSATRRAGSEDGTIAPRRVGNA